MTRSYTGVSFGLLFLALACGGSEFQSGDSGATTGASGSGGTGGSGGSGASGGGASASSGSGGSQSSIATGSGGSNSGSGGTSSGTGGASSGSGGAGGSGGSTPRGQCETEEVCLAAADFGDPCYSEGCSLPVGASQSDLERDSCLVLWDRRSAGRPETCKVPAEPVDCPLACAQEPECIGVACARGTCELVFGYDGETCGGTAGTGGTGGVSGTGGASATGGAGGSGGTGGASSDCDVLNEVREDALDSAVTCGPDLDVTQCTGQYTVPDGCGCPVLVNDYHQAAISAAQEAYDAWVDAECGPYPCGAPCASTAEGYCNEETSTCTVK